MTETPSPPGPPGYGPPGYGPPGYGPPSYGPPPGFPGGMSPGEERTWATAAHWSALVAAFLAMAFLGPLLVLLVKGNSSPWVRRHAVESLNFQLSMLIYGVVGGVLAVVVAILTLGLGLLLIIPLVLAFGAYWLIITVVAAVKTGNGEDYRYPLTIRMVS